MENTKEIADSIVKGLQESIKKTPLEIKESVIIGKNNKEFSLSNPFKKVDRDEYTSPKGRIKDFFTLSGLMDVSGIIKKNSGGIFSNALTKRDISLGNLVKKEEFTPKQTKESAAFIPKQTKEELLESNKIQTEQVNLLKKIEINTSGLSPKKNSAIKLPVSGMLGNPVSNILSDPVKALGIGSLLGLGGGFIKSGAGLLKKGFLKTKSSITKVTPMVGKAGKFALSKLAAPIALGIGAYNGINAGTDEYKKSGYITKAIKKGAYGILEGITGITEENLDQVSKMLSPLLGDFLFDPISKFVSKIKDLFNEYISTPLGGMFDRVKNIFIDVYNSIVETLKKIKIPEFEIGVGPLKTKIGPFEPFGSLDKVAVPSQSPIKTIPPTIPAMEVLQKSIEISAKKEETKGGSTTIVNAPSVSNKTVNSNLVKLPVRNPDPTVNRHVSRSYVSSW